MPTCSERTDLEKASDRKMITHNGFHLSPEAQSRLVQRLVLYGHEYRKRYLSKYRGQKMMAEWWPAFEFFIEHASYQGRKDAISFQVYSAAMNVLRPIFGEGDATSTYQNLNPEGWQHLEEELRKNIGKGKVGKGRDVDMYLSALKFIAKCPQLNIVKYSVDSIRQGRVDQHYAQLQPSVVGAMGVTQIGPKVASFYLRDLASIYELDSCVAPESAICLQPIDTHVEQLASSFGLVPAGANHHEIRRAIIELCHRENVSALLVNQGAWNARYNHSEDLDNLLSELSHSHSEQGSKSTGADNTARESREHRDEVA